MLTRFSVASISIFFVFSFALPAQAIQHRFLACASILTTMGETHSLPTLSQQKTSESIQAVLRFRQGLLSQFPWAPQPLPAIASSKDSLFRQAALGSRLDSLLARDRLEMNGSSQNIMYGSTEVGYEAVQNAWSERRAVMARLRTEFGSELFNESRSLVAYLFLSAVAAVGAGVTVEYPNPIIPLMLWYGRSLPEAAVRGFRTHQVPTVEMTQEELEKMAPTEWYAVSYDVPINRDMAETIFRTRRVEYEDVRLFWADAVRARWTQSLTGMRWLARPVVQPSETSELDILQIDELLFHDQGQPVYVSILRLTKQQPPVASKQIRPESPSHFQLAPAW